MPSSQNSKIYILDTLKVFQPIRCKTSASIVAIQFSSDRVVCKIKL